MTSKAVSNQPYDEAVDVSESESDGDEFSHAAITATDGRASKLQGSITASPTFSGGGPGTSKGGGSGTWGGLKTTSISRQDAGALSRGLGSEGSSDEEDDEEAQAAAPLMGYNPADYASLPVSSEIKELFQYIGRYKPHTIELDTKLKPFIPDYIPAVGDIDAFIKIPRPDGKSESLGLAVLDEPAANQSDPTVLALQLRAVSKQSNLQPMLVRSIENADKNPKAITTWVTSIADLHRSKPPPTVNYSKNMPDIEQLMQVWPEEFERLLQTTQLPSADLDIDLATFARVVCALLDIPVYSNLVQSLHVLFTLYSEFKSNPHFQQHAMAGSP